MSDPFITKDSIGQKFLGQLKGFTCYGGLDLSAVADLTAFVLTWQIGAHIYCYPWFFLPEDDLAERSRRDAVPYAEWLKGGYLEVCPGSSIDTRYVTTRLKELASYFKIVDVGFDAWGSREVVTELAEHGITCADVGQNISSMTAPAKRLETAVLNKELVHTGHPLLRWNCDCTSVYSDPNGNIKLVKPQYKKTSSRIDGIVALAMAISRVQKAKPVFKSVYSNRGVLTL